MKKILCIGDSNTWGHIPNIKNEQYSKNIRWCARLNNNEYKIDGFSKDGLTLNCKVAPVERIGLKKIIGLLNTTTKYNYIIVALGLNDLLNKYHNSTDRLCESYITLLKVIEEYKTKNNIDTNVILLNLPTINENAEFAKSTKNYCGINSKIKIVNNFLGNFCKKNDIVLIDVSLIKVGDDGVHFTEEGHNMIYEKLVNILEKKELEKSKYDYYN